MAFIIWRRGRYAELVHSLRSGSSVRQLRLAWLGAHPAITPALRAQVAAAHPHIPIDWDRIAAALARHPNPPEPAPDAERFDQLVAATAEPVLHDWLTCYHRRIRRERIATVETEWWPEFRSALLARPDLPDLLLHPLLLERAATDAVDAAETHHLVRQRAQQQAAAREAAAARYLLVSLIDLTLQAIQEEYSLGLEWARTLLGAFPSAEERAGDLAFLRGRADEALRRGEASPAAAERAIELVLAAARSWSRFGRLPQRRWDAPLARLPLDAPDQLITERAAALAAVSGLPAQNASRNAQVLLNLLDTRRREQRGAAQPRRR